MHKLRTKKLGGALAPRSVVHIMLTVVVICSFFPMMSHAGTNLRARGTSSIYIEAYVNFIAATTFELFQMMFQLTQLPNGDIGIGTNQKVKNLTNKEVLAQVSGASIVIRGIEGEMVQVSCSTEGALSNGIEKMPISNVEVAAGKKNTGDYGEGIQCAGATLPTISHVIGNQQDENTLYIGVRLQVNDKLAAARYSTSNPEGKPVAFEINYI